MQGAGGRGRWRIAWIEDGLGSTIGDWGDWDMASSCKINKPLNQCFPFSCYCMSHLPLLPPPRLLLVSWE